MRVLVTGGAGFIGSHLVEHLLAEGHRVHAVYDLSTGRIANLERFTANPRFRFDKADLITWNGLWPAAQWADRIYQLAAVVGVGVAPVKPDTRRVGKECTRGVSSPIGNAGARCYTTRRHNAHRTEITQEREVLYRWHPWAGRIVRIHEAVEKAGGTVLRCSRASGVGDRWLELPAWMFDRAACLAMRVTSEPVLEFASLAALQELLVIAAGSGDTALSSNTPGFEPHK